MVDDSRPPRSARRRAGAGVLLAAAFVVALTGCGKKGPPLAPLVRLPAAPDAFAARRFGSLVYVRFVVPSKNQDNSQPADIARVEVYGYTGTPATDADMVKYGTLVATVPVRRPPPPEDEDRQRGNEKKPGKPGDKPKATKPVEPEPGFDQGATVTVTETFSEALMRPVVVARRGQKKPGTASTKAPVLLPEVSTADVPSRVYVAVGVSRKGRRGVFTRHAAVPVLAAPPPPGDVKLSPSETAITVEWTPGPDAPVALAPEAERGVAVLPIKRIPALAGAVWSYDVFEVPAKPAAGSAPPATGGRPPIPSVDLPVALNSQPVTGATFTDPRIEFGTERCYVVRAVETLGALQVASDATSPACITPRDIYPPAAPKGLTAVANAGVVSLIWDANTEKDLDGYLVLRADAPGGTLERLTPAPIQQTTFNDTTVKAGVRYAYVVVAVDKAGNASAESNRVEETAR